MDSLNKIDHREGKLRLIRVDFFLMLIGFGQFGVGRYAMPSMRVLHNTFIRGAGVGELNIPRLSGDQR